MHIQVFNVSFFPDELSLYETPVFKRLILQIIASTAWKLAIEIMVVPVTVPVIKWNARLGSGPVPELVSTEPRVISKDVSVPSSDLGIKSYCRCQHRSVDVMVQ